MSDLDDQERRERSGAPVDVLGITSALEARWAKLDSDTRGWLILTAASIGRLAIGLVASIAVARALGPVNFGTYALLGVIATIAGVAADPGLTATGVKRVAAAFIDRSTDLASRASAFVILRVGLAFVMFVLVAVVVTTPMDSPAFPPSRRLLVVFTMGGVVATALSGAIASILQGIRQFNRLSLVLLVNSVLTAVLALALARMGQITLFSSIVILGVGTSLATAWVAWRFLPPEARIGWISPAVVRLELVRLLRFGSWVFVSDLLGIVAIQIDLPIISQWVDPSILGSYALALSLASKSDVVNHSLYTVLLPMASSLRGPGAVRRYLRQSFTRSGLVAAGLVGLLPVVGYVVPLLYGPSFVGAIGPLRALLGVAIVDVVATPVVLLAYHYDRPRILASADATRIVIFLVVAGALVPGLGITGAVIARLTGRVAGVAVALLGLRHAGASGSVSSE